MIALATNISLFFPTTEALILLIVSISPKYNGRFSCRNSKVVIHNFLLQLIPFEREDIEGKRDTFLSRSESFFIPLIFSSLYQK